MLYAKSKPKETIKIHAQKLIKNMEVLQTTYGKDILKSKNFTNEFWKLLEIICKYHDMGKVYSPFQNIILDNLGEKRIDTRFNYYDIKHEQLSPMFIPVDELTYNQKKLVYQAIYYHHTRKHDEVSADLVDNIIRRRYIT